MNTETVRPNLEFTAFQLLDSEESRQEALVFGEGEIRLDGDIVLLVSESYGEVPIACNDWLLKFQREPSVTKGARIAPFSDHVFRSRFEPTTGDAKDTEVVVERQMDLAHILSKDEVCQIIAQAINEVLEQVPEARATNVKVTTTGLDVTLRVPSHFLP